MLRELLLLGAFVALSSACCTPDQWEGGEGSVIGYSGPAKSSGLIREYIKAAYDYTNKRTAATLYYSNGDVKAKIRVVIRYDDDGNCYQKNCEGGRMYIVNEDKGTCYVKPLREPFRKACIPKEAKEMGDYYVGLEGGLKATAYELDGEDFSASISVSKLDNGACVPIGENIASSKGRYSTLSTVGFVDITPGIKNATVFDVPKECEETNYIPKEILRRQHHFFAL